MQVRFYETVTDEKLRFAVIIARSGPNLIFCRHRDRDTYEMPGGHREPGESIEACARRELEEETGALTYTLTPLCVYSVTGKNRVSTGEETFGMLYVADVLSGGKHWNMKWPKSFVRRNAPGPGHIPTFSPFYCRKPSTAGPFKEERVMIRPLIHDPIFLAQKAEPAVPGDESVAQDLLDTLQAHKSSCVGMAANMIGVKKAIIAFDDGGRYTVFYNPKSYRVPVRTKQKNPVCRYSMARAPRGDMKKSGCSSKMRGSKPESKRIPAGQPKLFSMKLTIVTGC